MLCSWSLDIAHASTLALHPATTSLLLHAMLAAFGLEVSLGFEVVIASSAAAGVLLLATLQTMCHLLNISNPIQKAKIIL